MKLQAFGHVLEIKHFRPIDLEAQIKRDLIEAYTRNNPSCWSHVRGGSNYDYTHVQHKNDGHIARIKAARALWDLGLKEAKDVADELWPEGRR